MLAVLPSPGPLTDDMISSVVERSAQGSGWAGKQSRRTAGMSRQASQWSAGRDGISLAPFARSRDELLPEKQKEKKYLGLSPEAQSKAAHALRKTTEHNTHTYGTRMFIDPEVRRHPWLGFQSPSRTRQADT